MSKSVQISKELFLDLIRAHLFEQSDPAADARIKAGLSQKLDSLVLRELYSEYHNANLTDEEREAARQRYLDKVGMKDSFRF